jgi:hypothetical protein
MLGERMTELDRLLERVTLEPAYGPAFYRALMAEPVFALLPAGAVFTERGTIRFIMWKGADDLDVIPFFSNDRIVERVLTPEWQVVRLQGRQFLEACRGAIVVLNPNEPYFCRLTAPELALLLDTGSPNQAESYRTNQSLRVAFLPPEAPPGFLESVSLLLAQCHDVDEAYFAMLVAKEADDVVAWLIAALIRPGGRQDIVAHRLSALLADRPPPFNLDFLTMRPGEATTMDFKENLQPFYARDRGSRLLVEWHSSKQ